VVEVSSPSTRRLELVRKRDVYQRFGVPEYWFVDLEVDRVERCRLDQGRYGPPTILFRGKTPTSPLTPGFSLPVDELLGPAED
jgi:Uma2 family endonuclease